ncbi:MAG: S8 family peptidase [Dehalococcoidia bacterium]|nr:S8 family peptidase [Dehalococcoidia bacterium]
MLTGRIRYGWLGLVALLLALAAMLPSAAGADEGDEQNVHPAVDVYAELFPGERVPVIVQSEDPTLVRWVTDHGGTVERRFDLLGGFEAEMPIEAVRALDFTDRADWISLNAPMMTSDRPERGLDASHLATVYPSAVGAPRAWRQGVTGDHVTVAVIDSGINPGDDFGRRITGSRNFSSESYFPFDQNGHGTWVAGIIAGRDARGRFLGIAPGADLLSVKVAGRDGSAHAGDVIEALQWVVRNKDRYDVRVINISLYSAIADSYLRDPLAAAVEEAWFQGIVVVVSAGNLGASPFAVDHAPANDPFVITVGSFDDRGTPARSDDVIADWSSRGVTVDGYAKPEVTAPGVGIVSVSGGNHSYLARQAPEAIVDGRYLRLSGSSASAAVVSGTVALMLDEDPSLTPDEVKYRAAATGAPLAGSQAPALDAAGAAFTTLEGAANGGALPNEFIDPETGTILRDSILWRSILWRSILWRNILWRNILWSR